MALAEDWAIEPPSDSYEPVSFGEDIELGPFARVGLKNALLNIVTLGFYRFWGRTEVRRRLWARISLNDEPFEYTGRGMELFVGFLIAVAVVGAPLIIIVGVAQLLPPVTMVAIMLLVYLGLFTLMGAARFMAFRYLSSRTTWRGIRFQLRGSALEFGLAYLGYLLLTGLTLGWFQPAMAMRVAARLWGPLRFGSLPLRWKTSNQRLYGAFALGWALTAVGYVLLLGGIVALRWGASGSTPSIGQILMIYPLLFAFLLLVAFAFAPYHAAVLRKIVSSIQLSNARFKLDVKALDLMGLTIANILLLVVSLGILYPMIEARTGRFLVRRLSSEGTAPLSWARQAPAGSGAAEGLADAFGIAPV